MSDLTAIRQTLGAMPNEQARQGEAKLPLAEVAADQPLSRQLFSVDSPSQKARKDKKEKIKKLTFNFADIKKGQKMLVSSPKSISKYIKKYTLNISRKTYLVELL